MSPTLAAIVFFVQDLDRTEAFYRDALGLHPERIEGDDGPMLTAATGSGGPELVFLVAPEPPGRSPVVVFGLAAGIQDAGAALVQKGVEIVTPLGPAPDGGLTADFADPDGHVLSYHQPVD